MRGHTVLLSEIEFKIEKQTVLRSAERNQHLTLTGVQIGSILFAIGQWRIGKALKPSIKW